MAMTDPISNKTALLQEVMWRKNIQKRLDSPAVIERMRRKDEIKAKQEKKRRHQSSVRPLPFDVSSFQGRPTVNTLAPADVALEVGDMDIRKPPHFDMVHWLKYKTMKEGEQAVVFNYLGEGKLVIGPQRLFLYRKRFQLLRSYTADSYHYLVLKDKDGVVHHKQGPCQVFFDPLLLDSVTVEAVWKLDANHMVVVYKRLEGGKVERRVIQGPAVFVPQAEEWMHKFCWHGGDQDKPGRMIPGANKFTQLTIIPDQFYYDVREVRTNDDTMITVKLMIFYSLQDVIKMLEATHDPIADLINAVCADVIMFVGKLSYNQFLEKSHTLNNMAAYPQLLQRAERVGFNVGKVVYRGYHASDQLQMMQNNAIESRTRMRLEAEVQDQQQKLSDFKLSKEQARLQLKHNMQELREHHQQLVDQLCQDHQLQLQQMSHAQTMTLQEQQLQASLDHKGEIDLQKLTYLHELQGMHVDLDRYLSSRQDAPIREEIQVVTPCN